MHEFAEDFYGATLEVCVAGYIRPEKQFVLIGEQNGVYGAGENWLCLTDH